MTLSETDYSGWIGKSVESTDLVTQRLVDEYRVTLEPFLAPVATGDAPLCFHWCLSPSLVPMAELGPDGHPHKGGFLPPVPLPRRMWAGGEIEFFGSIRIGDAVKRVSTIASVEAKQGRTGPLCFVGVHHEYMTPRGVAIRERHNIVYREAAVPRGKPPAQQTEAAAQSGPERPAHASVWCVTPSPTLLFRYSALTFNGHRIHYDQPYATGVEGYENLVVHGPLQATLMLNRAVAAKGAGAKKFTYRGMAQLTSGMDFDVVAVESGAHATCWTQRSGGPENSWPINMQGEVQW